MTRSEHAHLKILNSVTAEPDINQRRLAERLGASIPERSPGPPKNDLARSAAVAASAALRTRPALADARGVRLPAQAPRGM